MTIICAELVNNTLYAMLLTSSKSAISSGCQGTSPSAGSHASTAGNTNKRSNMLLMKALKIGGNKY